MGPIYVDELKAANSSSTFNDLSNDINDATDIKNLIDNFVSGSNGMIKGEVWTEVQSKLNQYSSAMTDRMNLANKLSEAIKKSLNILITYMGDEYASLDYSELPELESKRAQCDANINSVNRTLNSIISSNEKETDSSKKKDTSHYSNLLAKYQEELNELDKHIEKLKGLKGKYEEAEEILKDAFAEVVKMKKSVSNIVPSNKVTYLEKSQNA